MSKNSEMKAEHERLMNIRLGFQVHLSMNEKAKLVEAAKRARKPVATFIRDVALAAAATSE